MRTFISSQRISVRGSGDADTARAEVGDVDAWIRAREADAVRISIMLGTLLIVLDEEDLIK